MGRPPITRTGWEAGRPKDGRRTRRAVNPQRHDISAGCTSGVPGGVPRP